MALKDLKNNIEEEKDIARELIVLSKQEYGKSGMDKEMIRKTSNSLIELIKIINNSIPVLVENISPIKKLGKAEDISGLVNVKYNKGGTEKDITINEKERKRFFRELSLSEFGLKRAKRDEKEQIVVKDFKKPSMYAKISNKLFSRISQSMINKGYFKDVEKNLKKANIPFIMNTYISMMFFSTAAAILFSFLLFVFLAIFSLSLSWPFIQLAELTAIRLLINTAVSVALPILVFFSMYFYPYAEASSISKKITQELPFVTMYMSAIAGSGIEPSQIFKIIGLGKEYPHVKQEIKKIINQINLYGFDLVSALKNTARTTSNAKLAELFNGLATTISSGGSLVEFLDKRTETLLFDYKLERERSTKLAETFMDIYISIVIAAPMIMMILLILISVGPLSMGLELKSLTVIIISVVALINIVFLAILQIKQPNY